MAAPVVDPCDAIRKVTRDALASSKATVLVENFDAGAQGMNDAQCVPDAARKDRAWGVVTREIADSGGDPIRYGLARFAPDTGLVVVPIKSVAIGEHAQFDPLVVFDFDGDSSPEVFVKSSYYHEGSAAAELGLYSFVSGKIVPYKGAAGHTFDSLEDGDQDGRPDLVRRERLDGGTGCGSGFPNDGEAPPFLIHSLKGGSFVEDDAATRAYVRTWCPKRPTSVATVEEIVCRRLYGEAPKALDALVRRVHSEVDCDREMAGKAQKKNATPDYEKLRSATRTTLPFTFVGP